MFNSLSPLSTRDLSSPLLPSHTGGFGAVGGGIGQSTKRGDEESQRTIRSSGNGFVDGDDVVDGGVGGETDDLPKRVRSSFKFLSFYYSKLNGPLTAVYYFVYVLVAVCITGGTMKPGMAWAIIGLIGIILFWLVQIAQFPFSFTRMFFRWCGSTKVIVSFILNAVTISFFLDTWIYGGKTPDAAKMYSWALIISLAFALLWDTKVYHPCMDQLYWASLGALAAEEINDKTGRVDEPFANIDAQTLQKVARHASEAVGISDEATQRVISELQGLSIVDDGPDGSSHEDWSRVIYKLSKIVYPFALMSKKASITPAQYRTLVRQMIMYFRSYMATGEVSADESDRKRTVPLSFGECIWLMLRLSMQVPSQFFLALVPRSCQAAIMIAGTGYGFGMFTRGIISMDSDMAGIGFWILMGVYASSPILLFIANIVETRYGTAMIDCCRRRMLAVMLRGGTKYEEHHRGGKLIDAFSNQITQLENFCVTFFVGLIPSLIGITAGVIMAATVWPFASILFVSLVPVVISIEYFTSRASRAAMKRAKIDGLFTGKLASAVECRAAIRVCNASTWIESDMEQMLIQTKNAHRNGYFRSMLVQNSTDFIGAFYMLLMLIPLGIQVVNFELPFDYFTTLMTPLASMIASVQLLGMAQNQVTLYTGALLTVKELMDDSLVEEPLPKKNKGGDGSVQGIQLSALSDSLQLSGVMFRYSPRLPDVLKNFTAKIGKGEYMVLCGGSGSGKSTVLNLLMRFREPREGSIQWDGTNIFETSLSSFRKHVSVMFQQTMIYQATLKENILFGMPEVPGGVQKAAESAEIASVIENLPDGYDTVIGGDAIAGMSGGQLQRVCLARALYRNPSVLLLDEATSALDAKTETEIIDTLVKLRDEEGLTMVSVSHHPSTAVNADSIVVLDHGVVAEEGRYDDLLSREGGIFRGLVEAGETDKSD